MELLLSSLRPIMISARSIEGDPMKNGPLLEQARETSEAEPFFIGLNRAMVSLGPATKHRHCSFRCTFCYVQGPFPKYASRTPSETVRWLKERRNEFDMIYISGDTDSFAEPRMSQGLDLLEQLITLNCDVLFTTRASFKTDDERRLYAIASEYVRCGLLLVGCVSVSQLFHPALEPRPIMQPRDRIDLLGRMRANSIRTVLTIRPLIPAVPASEYVEIARLGYESADVILAGDLYVDSKGIIETALAESIGSRPEQFVGGLPHQLDFSLDDTRWRTIHNDAAAQALSIFCEQVHRPFFMRSGPAIEWIRSNLATR
jgi:hypothetical protein